MTQISWPWSGTTVGDAVHAPYTNKFFADMFQYLNVYDRTIMGVVDTGYAGLTGGLFVTAGAGFVSVDTGIGVSDGMWLVNTASVNLTPDDTPSIRTDLVVIRKTISVAPLQEVRLVLLKGTDGSAVPSALTQDLTTWEIPLAEVPITPGPTIGTVVNVAVAVRTALGPGYQFAELTANDSTHTALAWNDLTPPVEMTIGPGKWSLSGALTVFVQSLTPDIRIARIYDSTLAQELSVGRTGMITDDDQVTICLPPTISDSGVVRLLKLQFWAGGVNDIVLSNSAGPTQTSMLGTRVI